MGKKIQRFFMFIMSFIFLAYFVNVYLTEKKEEYKKETIEGCTKNSFEVKEIKWLMRYPEEISISSITIKNIGDADCEDIKGTVIFFSQEKEEIGRKDFIIHERLNAMDTKTFRDILFRNLPYKTIYNASVDIIGAKLIKRDLNAETTTNKVAEGDISSRVYTTNKDNSTSRDKVHKMVT